MHRALFVLLVACLSGIGSWAAQRSAPPKSPPWHGVYVFEEFGPHTGKGAGPVIGLRYKLSVAPKGEALTANLDIDGYQTRNRIRCRVAPFGSNSLRFFLQTYRAGNALRPYPAGSHLFTLTRGKDRGGSYYKTRWVALKPQFTVTEEPLSAKTFHKARG